MIQPRRRSAGRDSAAACFTMTARVLLLASVARRPPTSHRARPPLKAASRAGRRHDRTFVRLFEEDSSLLQHVLGDRGRRASRETVVPAYLLRPGPWRARAALLKPTDLGLLALDGLISTETTIAGRRGLELLGPGDLILPVAVSNAPDAVAWQVLAPTRLALLGDRTTKALAEIPGVLPELIRRTARRSRYLSMQHAISSIHPMARRVHVFLWHLADRWGRWDGGVVVLPFALTHEALAELIGAERPSVTAALGELRRSGAVDRGDDGAWVLHGLPPLKMRERPAIPFSENV